MLKKTIKYIDFNGEKREDTVYFNLTEPEVVRLDVEFEGGLETYVSNFDPEVDPEAILTLFERIIQESYGEKSNDGRHFIKDSVKTKRFNQSAAYSALFMELVKNGEIAAEFFNRMLSTTSIKKKPPKPSVNRNK